MTEANFTDPLTDCLLYFAKEHGKSCSATTIRAGLPLVDNKLTPQLFADAAKRINLNASIVKRDIHEIPKIVLPCVLILQNNKACILINIKQQMATVVIPEEKMATKKIPIDEIAKGYSGYAILVKPIHQFDERATQYHKHQPKSWFWGTLWEYRTDFFQLILAAFLINLFVLVSPLYIMNVYDRVIPNNALETLWVLAIGVLTIYTFDLLIKMARTYVIESTGKKIDIRLGSRLFAQTLNIRLAFKPASAGAFASNLRDFELLREFFTSATIISLVDIPFIILFLFVISLIGGPIVLVPLLAMPIVILVTSFIRIPLAVQTDVSMQGSTQKNALVVEALSSTEAIKSLGAEGQWQSKWESFCSQTATAGQKVRQLTTSAMSFTGWVMQIVSVLVVIIGVYQINNGELTMGGLIACVILSPRCLAPLSGVTNLLMRYHYAKSSLVGLNKIMTTPTDRPPKKTFLHRPKMEGDIIFDNVNFSYPNQKHEAINQVSFHIKPGEKVALIGPLGAGKTTTLKLILGFYSADKGKILIDGTDLDQIDPSDLRRNMAYAPQETALFYGSIRENILLGQPWTNDEKLLNAIKLSGINQLISQNPAGIDMPISERGESLSGGQRQRVSMARVFLSGANMVLLDEPTSAMDNASEIVMIENIRRHCENKTLIICTHKSIMLRLVDRLIVVENGKIIADGPKEQILSALRKNQEHFAKSQHQDKDSSK